MRHLLFTIAFLIFMFACNKPYESTPNGAGLRDRCHAFDPEMISRWMPYEQHKTYYYLDSNGIQYILTVDSQHYSDEYSAAHQSCIISGDIYALTDTTDTLDINMNVSYYLHAQDPGGPTLAIRWQDAWVYFSYYSQDVDTLKPKWSTQSNNLSIKDKMSFGGKEYHTVHELTVNKNKLQKLYIAKGHGVVAFTTTDSTLHWLSE